LTPYATLNPAAVPAGGIEGLYVHVPFCFHKCHYCDFYSITRQTPQRMDRFVDLVLREADQWAATRPAESLQPRTIFFGGGTPSLLPFDSMRRLLIGLGERFDLSRVDEWTIEVNPATADEDYCRMLRAQ
jgi:oxygen-independent coproporphyrinogen-3 oxidase